MGKIENILEKKFKQSLISSERDNLVAFAEYMFDKLWKIPKERERMIENMEIAGISLKPAEPIPKKRVPKPKTEAEPKKPKPKKRVTLSDEDIAKSIVEELKDEPEETIEVAEPPKEPTADVVKEEKESVKVDDAKEEPLEPIEPEKTEEKPEEKSETHFVKSEESEEVDEMMK